MFDEALLILAVLVIVLGVLAWGPRPSRDRQDVTRGKG
jgi:hypothetical protein